jgi:hypothetical protein
MKRFALLTACILCFTACNSEVELPADPPAPSQQIQLFLSDMETVSVYSAATAAECTIDTLWVAVFDGNAKRWVEKIEGSRILNNGHETMLVPQLKHEIENGNTVVCIANPRSGLYPPDTTTLTYDRINVCFLVPFGFPYAALPMYGQIDSWSATNVVCQMTRSVAKIQIQLGEAFESVYPLNVTDIQYYLCGLPFVCEIKLQSPPVLYTGAAYVGFGNHVRYLLQNETVTEAEKSRYVYEYPNSSYKIDDIANPINKNEFDSRRTFVVLHIITNQQQHCYRLDFYDHATQEYIDIKRNHRYLFTINKISSPGYLWPKWDECWYNPPSNIEYTVRVEDDSRSITSNGQYAVVTRDDTVKITGDVTDQAVTTFRYINQTGSTLQTQTDTIYVESPHIRVLPPGATLTITSPQVIGENLFPITNTNGVNQELRITTTGNLEEANIIFRFGNIWHYLPVRKVYPK